MRKSLTCGISVVGLGIVFIASAYVAARLRANFGYLPPSLMALGFYAAWVATPESRAMAARVLAALRESYGSLKEAAADAGMGEPQLSRQLNNQEQMSLSRFASWKPAFWMAFCQRMVNDSGGGVVITHSEMTGIFLELRKMSSRRQEAA